MDEISKFRLTGAAIWLLLLVIVVPSWYSNPVNFNPDSETEAEFKSTEPVVYQQYVLPVKDEPIADIEQPFIKPVNKASDRQESEMVTTAAKETKPTMIESEKVVKATAKSTLIKSVGTGNPEPKAGEWLLKVYGSKDIKAANRVLGLLDDKYEVWIKEFPKAKSFSVRTGPYKTRSEAERDKRKIDKAIRTHSVIVQVK